MSNAIVTVQGLQKIADFQVTGVPVNMTHIAVGDGGGSGYNPTGDETALRNEVWRSAIAASGGDGLRRYYEVIIPEDVGGFWIREFGLFDDEGTLIAIGRVNSFYKVLDTSGEVMGVTLRVYMAVSNQAAVTVTVESPGGVLLAANNLSELEDAEAARDNLGLGTAAVAETQTDDYDLTEDRLVKVSSVRRFLGAFDDDNIDRVVLLHRAFDTTPVPYASVDGRFTLAGGAVNKGLKLESVNITVASAYTASRCLMYGPSEFVGQFQSVYCVHNGVKYAALKLPRGRFGVGVFFNGQIIGGDANTLKVIEYYNAATSTVLDAEVEGSIEQGSSPTGFKVAGHTVYHEGNTPTVSTPEINAGTSYSVRMWAPVHVKRAAQAVSMGYDQLWQNVTLQREAGTAYTNDTGRPISVSVVVNMGGSSGLKTVTGYVDDMAIVQDARVALDDATPDKAPIFFTVPPGSTYRVEVDGNTGLHMWCELR